MSDNNPSTRHKDGNHSGKKKASQKKGLWFDIAEVSKLIKEFDLKYTTSKPHTQSDNTK